MTGIDLHAIGQGCDAFTQAAVQFVSERMPCLVAQQVWTTKRTNEEEVSSKECEWLRPVPFLVEVNKAQVLTLQIA